LFFQRSFTLLPASDPQNSIQGKCMFFFFTSRFSARILLSSLHLQNLAPEQVMGIKPDGIGDAPVTRRWGMPQIGITVWQRGSKSLPAGDVFNTTARAIRRRYLRNAG
jgi:hypothetical protein